MARPALRALEGAGITSLKELAKFSEEEIAKLHEIGKNAVMQLKAALSEKGLHFKKK